MTGIENKKETLNNKKDYKDYLWYSELSDEQKDNIDLKYEKIYKIKKEIKKSEKKIESTKLKIDITVDNSDDLSNNQDYNEILDILNRDLDLLNRKLYSIKLKENAITLNDFHELAINYFKNGFIKEGEENEFIISLIENKGLDNITAGEVYFLRNNGYDISKLFLKGTENRENLTIGDKFTVSFGQNKSISRFIGAGDLFDLTKVKKVKINGVEGTVKYNPRPGFYTTSGRYLSIFNNYSIEIIELYGKKGNEGDNKKLEEAYKKRYLEVRRLELLPLFYSTLNQEENRNENSIILEKFLKEDLNIINDYIKEKKLDFELNINEKSISTKNAEKNIGDIITAFIPKRKLGIGYKRYENIVIEVTNNYPNISKEDLVILINHENGRWDPLAGTPGSSAYGLGQMIDSTWNTYGKGLNRNNPKDQLIATCRYLDAIMKRKNCNVNLAMAYYNTGEGILNISDGKAKEYASINAPIRKKIPNNINITAKVYFIGAVAYYNDISYEEAEKIS